MYRVSFGDTIVQLLEFEQGQATPLIDRFICIALGRFVIDQGDQYYSSSVPEAHRQI